MLSRVAPGARWSWPSGVPTGCDLLLSDAENAHAQIPGHPGLQGVRHVEQLVTERLGFLACQDLVKIG